MGGRFHVLRFMAALKAARDFGLEPAEANAIALHFDPRSGCLDRVLDELTAALVARGAVDVPASG